MLDDTLKLQYNVPYNNEIPGIKNLILRPFRKKTCNKKTFAIKNKIFNPFRFVKPRFLCNDKSYS
jgi:hypothetical protein